MYSPFAAYKRINVSDSSKRAWLGNWNALIHLLRCKKISSGIYLEEFIWNNTVLLRLVGVCHDNPWNFVIEEELIISVPAGNKTLHSTYLEIALTGNLNTKPKY